MSESPDPSTALTEAALALLQSGDFTGAVQELVERLETHPEHPVLHNMLGSAHAGLGQVDKARACVQQAITLDPCYANAHHNLGLLSLQEKDAETACRHFQQAYDLAPDDPGLANSLAAALYAAQDAARALDTIETALLKSPEDLPLRKARAEYLLASHRPKQALEAFADVIEQDPTDGQLHLSMALTLRLLHRPGDAGETLKTAAHLMPDNHEVYLETGRVWMAGQRYDKARMCFEKASSLAPNEAVIFRDLSKALQAQGQPAAALRHLKHSLALDPDNAETRHFINALTGQPSTRAPKQYVTDLFDDYADGFEAALTDDLGYDAYKAAAKLARQKRPKGRFSSVLDLGCGTGLFGTEIHPATDRLTGVDLSSRMIAHARNTGLYDTLLVADVVETLKSEGAAHDLYAATDVFTYLGDLTPVFTAFAEVARPGALMVFTTEALDGDGYQLRTTGRFAHSRSYIDMLVQSSGLTSLSHKNIPLRREEDSHLQGGLYLIEKPKG